MNGKFQKGTKNENPNARAPYNFIPLNESVVGFDKAPDMDRYFSDRHSGHINLAIETLTPLYIRGTSKDPNQECNTNPEFFSPGGAIKIPGSSLRGMVRELVEIVSFGKFQCDDRQLFFRNIADIFYRNTMIDTAKNCFPRAKTGLLVRRGGRYFIQPSQNISGTDHYRINGSFNGATFSIPGITCALSQFTFRRIYFKPVAPIDNDHRDFKGNPIKLRYALVKNVSDTAKDDYIEGYLVISGKFANKKHMQWIINKPGATPEIEIPEVVVDRYAEDITREEKADLFEMLNGHKEAPCFYLTDNAGKVSAFGHTGLFRHPYKYSVHQHLDPELLNDKSIDCVETIFGKLEHWAGRVFFEDALLSRQNLKPGQQKVLMGETSPKILSGPKPTTFQHYLDTNHGRHQHWGVKDAKLRGYKLYWHRDTQQPGACHWSEGHIKNDSQHTVISPVRPDTIFNGRIRFENLSSEELGALLFVINLPKTCRHKLGMGKPLGLGSVKITPQLVLTDRENRYRNLFDNTGTGWALSEKVDQTQTVITAFETFMLNKISVSEKGNAAKLWDTARLQTLKTMLDWSNTQKSNWNDKTRYLEIGGGNEYKGRPVLPGPIAVAT